MNAESGRVVTTPAFDLLVDDVALVLAEQDEKFLPRFHHVAEAKAAITAALHARSEEDCTTCGGTQTDPAEYRGNMDSIEGYPCPDCEGTGKRPGHSLLVAALVEAKIDVVAELVKVGALVDLVAPEFQGYERFRRAEVLQGDQPQ